MLGYIVRLVYCCIKQRNEMFRCFYCGTKLCWNSDANLSDIGYSDDDFVIVSFYHCPNCGRDYEIADPPQEERDSTYKDYWK